MTIFQAVILGLIQGLGEFLPISSSGHLVLAPWLFGFKDPGLSFDVALHFGTLLAVVVYFWKDWINILKHSFQYLFSKKNERRDPNHRDLLFTDYCLLIAIIIATVPGAIFGFLLDDFAETVFRSPLLIAGTLSLLGLFLYLADKFAARRKNLKEITKKEAVLIGLSQAFAVIPGISRSGATITAGLFLNFDRKSTARFSFLLSAPIIFGAIILKIPYLLDISPAGLIAIIVSALSGFFAISWMLRFIEKVSYKIFFWYRLFAALTIISVWIIRM